MKRSLIEPEHKTLSITKQCQLLSIPRSTFYYRPVGISSYQLELMHLIDEIFTRHPYYGARSMQTVLFDLGYQVNRKRLRRLYYLMGLEAVYPKKNLSKRHPEHKIYPYLLRNISASYPNHVWSTDITYIRMHKGFVYLMAIMDWFSRFVLDWQLSISLESDFCIETLQRALEKGRCTIFNTDQGAQFTTPKFTSVLDSADIQISMDGKGRATDNAFVERLWRSVKYEKIYLNDYHTVQEVRCALDEYFYYYNFERPHQGIKNRKPADLYYADY